MRRNRRDEWNRRLVSENALSVNDLIWPLFVHDHDQAMAVEAMRAGVPLIVSDIPVHREICGDAALYFQLSDPKDLAARIEELNSN